jgi:hypothetical protein
MDAALVIEAGAPEKARARGLGKQIRRRPRRRRFAWALIAAATSVVCAIALFVRGQEPPRDAAGAPPPNLSAIYQARDDLPPLLYVKSLDGGRAAARYVAQIRDSDGARRDTLTLGDPASAGPFLVAAARLSAAATGETMFFVDLARLAAESGLAVARASNGESDLALGPLIFALDVTLQGPRGYRDCLGFRFKSDGKASLFGLACGELDRPGERSALACLVTRLRATSDGAATGLSTMLGAEGAADSSSC